MYTIYNYESCDFRVCLYNNFNDCCGCESDMKCKWVELSSHTDFDSGNNSCQFTTSQSGLYQFQIYTYNYPCFFDIGEPIDVVDDSLSSSHDQFSSHIVTYSVGELFLLVLSSILITYLTYQRRQYQRQQHLHRQARLGKLLLNIDMLCTH